MRAPTLHKSSSNALPIEKLVTTPILDCIECDYNTRYALIVCRLCQAGVPLSRMHSHAKAEKQERSYQANSLMPLSKVLSEPIPHGFKVGMSKDCLMNTIRAELEQKLGQAVDIRDVDEKAKREWYDSAVPLADQLGPILGIRVIQHGAICNLCPEASVPCCGMSEGSLAVHRSETELSGHYRAKAEKFRVGPIQTMTNAMSLCRYYPVPGGGMVESEVPVHPDTANGGESDEDDVAQIIQREKRKLMGPMSGSASDLLDERTLVPFYRDYGVHEFLRQYEPSSILELIQIPDRRSKGVSLPLRRLYAIVIETFLADCEMAVKMNPGIRRLIMQSDPYVVSSQLCQ
jgi:hypothetical protein